MAKTPTTIGAGLKLDGEDKFKKALENINAAVKVNTSLMALVTAQYSANANSVQALTAKNESLKDVITAQSAKVETLRNAFAASATANGETNKRRWNMRRTSPSRSRTYQDENEVSRNNESIKRRQ